MKKILNCVVTVMLMSSFLFSMKKILKCVVTVDYKRKQPHIFVERNFAIKLWSNLKDYCQCSFDIPILNPQSATLGLFEINPDLFILLNHILLLYKYYISSSRESSKSSFICSHIGKY